MSAGHFIAIIVFWFGALFFAVVFTGGYRRAVSAERALGRWHETAVDKARRKQTGSNGSASEPFIPEALCLLSDEDREELRSERIRLTKWLGTRKLSDLTYREAADYEAMALEHGDALQDRTTMLLLLPGLIFSVAGVPLLAKYFTAAKPPLWVFIALVATALAIMTTLFGGLASRREGELAKEQARVFAKRKEEARNERRDDTPDLTNLGYRSRWGNWLSQQRK